MINKTAHVLWFKEIHKEDIPVCGGKGANLGEMINANIPVPNGFVVTATAYFDFVNSTSLKRKLETELNNLDINDSQTLQKVAENIQTAIMAAEMPEDLIKQIKTYYHELCGESDRYVAVRSSATAEDLPDASFAGQQETYLNIKGWQDVVKKVQECWASLFGARAIFYRATNNYSHFSVGIAVPVQLMVQSEFSGIMFTVNPLSLNHDEVSVEAAYGLCQPIVSGEITPDQYLVSKKSRKIVYRYVSKQTWQFTLSGNTPVSAKFQEVQKIPNKLAIDVAELGMKIEKHYGRPQDIEWAVEGGKVFIVQSRPITTLEKKIETTTVVDASRSGKALLQGLAASPGVATGKVVIIKDASEINKVLDGDILVAEMTNPDYVPAMKRAAGIVTDLGGRTSHAAIVSRELGVPAIVGTDNATKILTTGELITVDGAAGMVYEGDVTKKQEVQASSLDTTKIKTATKIYMNLAEPELAEDMAKRNVDGVGLLRAEFIMANIGKHPKAFIKEGKQQEFVTKLADGLEKFAKAFNPRPVVYRFNDFKSNEYAHLEGGAEFEKDEPNPMIGYRGVSRYVKEPEVFNMEVEAIKYVRNKLGYKNLWVMMPFVRSIDQFRQVKHLLAEGGLKRSGNFKFWMMVEIPANVILLDEFLDEGVDGVSVGTNDLTMLTLGVDRDNDRVADSYSEMNEAVLRSLEKIATTCKRRKVTCSVCGQAPSVFPELVKMLVKWGMTSVSVSPDVIEKTRGIVYECEKQILKEKSKK